MEGFGAIPRYFSIIIGNRYVDLVTTAGVAVPLNGEVGSLSVALSSSDGHCSDR